MGIPPDILIKGDKSALEEAATDLYEWLSLLRLQSPRVAHSDTTDPYLSRYVAPGHDTKTGTDPMQICMFSWQGFISTEWLRSLIQDAFGLCPPKQWFSVSATGFSKPNATTNSDLTLLCPSKAAGEYLMWEIRGSN